MSQHGRIHGGDFRRLVRNLRTGQHLKMPILQIMTPRRIPSRADLEESVRQFNAQCPVGSWVEYRSVLPDSTGPGTAPHQYEVRGPAYVHEGHTAAVFLKGKSGFVDVHHCKLIPTPAPAAINDEDTIPPGVDAKTGTGTDV